jgi:N-acetylmuramoyl-L-alanine amidase
VELIIDIYDKNETLIGHAQGTNRVRAEAKGIRKAVFSFLRPNTATRIDDIAGIDNLRFKPEKPVVVLDPGHGLLLDSDGKTLHYQRPASPTFGLHEDDLTLLIANAAKQQLELDKYTVFLTRSGPHAPITVEPVVKKGCSDSGFPPYSHCNDDLLRRINKTIAINQYSPSGAVFVSIHTNGSDKEIIKNFINGTESFHCSTKVDSSPLAKGLRDGIVALGTWSLFVKNGCSKGILKHMPEEDIPNSLIEVAYHSNTFKLPGPTDEERLNDPAFRADAGKAIATAIEQYIEDMLTESR